MRWVMRMRVVGLVLALAFSLAAGPARPAASGAPSGPTAPTSIGCPESDLANALAGGGSISFNCGLGPHAVLFNPPIVVTTTASIDGAGQITLSGQNTTTLFLIQSGA